MRERPVDRPPGERYLAHSVDRRFSGTTDSGRDRAGNRPVSRLGEEEQMARDPKAAQKAAEKRKKREKELRAAQARRKAQEAGAEAMPKKFLQKAAELPIAECVISKGWQERGLAHVLLARELPTGRLLVAGYYVDTLCLGLKDTAVMPNLRPEEYEKNIKPKVFNDPVELEPCAPSLAKAVIEGAIEYAHRFGFKPNKRWEESRRLLEGIEPAPDELQFGREGKPCLVLRGGEKAPGALVRLERSAGPGGYAVVEEPGRGA
jgi:hypothetical protein